MIASAGPEGLDATPRGDPAPVAAVLDPGTVALPDRPGNNRLDTLRNIVRDPRVALLFLIPGVGETMRVNGRAEISIDPDHLARFELSGKLPRSVLLVTVERAYFQCQKALVRSRLWDPETRTDRSALPSIGAMLERISDGEVDGAAYDADYPERMNRSIY